MVNLFIFIVNLFCTVPQKKAPLSQNLTYAHLITNSSGKKTGIIIITHSVFDTRSLLTFLCAWKTKSIMCSNGCFTFSFFLFFWVSRILMVGFHLSQSHLLLAATTNWFLDQRGLRAIFSCFRTVILIFAASLPYFVRYPWLSLSSFCSVTFPHLSPLILWKCALTRH